MGIGRDFMNRTRYRYLGESEQERGLTMPPLQWPVAPDAELLDLPHPSGLELAPANLRELMEQRTSVRRYSAARLSLQELSYLLWCTQGVKEVGPGYLMRTVPSAGARHALETYVIVNSVQGLEAGLYRFVAVGHRLARLKAPMDLGERAVAACFGQSFVATASATFVWVAIPHRMTWRYPERGYRYLHLDAGHACQNLYLAAEAIGGGVCAIAAFDDDAMATLLDLDPEEQFVIYLATVGKKLVR